MTETVPDGLLSGLRNYWYPILRSQDLAGGEPLGIRRLDENLVVWRDRGGVPHTLVDRCAHRGVPLSIGRVLGDRIRCRYHGLQYDTTGQCRLVPSENEGEDGPTARELCVKGYPTEERGGVIWSYLGEVDLFPPPPLEVEPEIVDPEFDAVIEPMVWNANWLLTWDNADPAHVPVLHGDTLLLSPMVGGGRIDRIKAEETGEGTILTSRVGVDDDDRWTGETFDAVEFKLPALGRLWVPVPGGGPLLRVLQWMYPIDRESSLVFVWHGRKLPDEEARRAWRLFWDKVVWPNAQEVYAQDNEIVSSQGDVRDAWAREHLIRSDIGVPMMRKKILDAYDHQQKIVADAGTGTPPGR